MTLPHDVTRCHDVTCLDREHCRRRLERSTGSSHARSCFPYDEPIDQPCHMQILPIEAL